MKHIWLNSYPPGVTPEINARAFGSLKDMFEHSFARFGDLPAFLNLGAALTYGEVDKLSRNFAAFVRNDLGLERGDRIAIMLPNVLQYPVAVIGALRAGLVVVNVNPLYTASELQFQLADSGAHAIVVLENFAHTLEAALRKTRVRQVITTQIADLFPAPRRGLLNFAVKRLKHAVPPWDIPGAIPLREALREGRYCLIDDERLGPDNIAFLQYTGGTTGRPKGAVLTHGNLVANVEQTAAWIGAALKEREETVVTALPLYHIFALTANFLVFFRLGGRNLLITDPRNLRGLLKDLARTRFTAITGVNTLFKALLEAEGFDAVRKANAGALKLAITGGMAAQRSVAEAWHNAMGVPLIEGYGLTEASPIVCANRLDAREFTGKLGLPLPSTEVAILDEHGQEVALGQTGEICVRGPQVMREYWNAAEETAKAFTADGWLRTGDLGRMDERGYVEFTERTKDVIVVSGFKAYPNEIEHVAMLHPGVKDAGAAAIPDERSGEAVALYVVRSDPSLTADALREHCARHLAPYKRPRLIEFRDTLPKSPIGKTLHRELHAHA
ncbi:MAG TPA: AMP-binding protein [Burkholderiales bacterium]|nr:AMP-binding protein [Burkholderiales bacterium]